MTNYALKAVSISHDQHGTSGDMSQKNWRWCRWGISCLLLVTGATANAAAFQFDGGAVAGCTFAASTNTYTCASSPSTSADTVNIQRGYSVIGDLDGASAVLSRDAILNGNLNVVGAVTMGQSARVSANLTSKSGTVTLAQSAFVGGNLYAGTTVTMAANATVSGNVTAGETVTMAAGVRVGGNVRGTTVSLAADGVVTGSVSGTTVSLAAGASIGGSVLNATTVSLAANATVFGNVNGTTVSLAANGCVRGNVWAATTVSLAQNATIGGSVVAGTTFSLAQNASVGRTVTVSGALLPPGTSTNGLGGSSNCPYNNVPVPAPSVITITTTTPDGDTSTTSCTVGVNCGCAQISGVACTLPTCVMGVDPLCPDPLIQPPTPPAPPPSPNTGKVSWRQLK
jgi:cytoskeletal protein CcmA (bactofilin family)